MQVGDPNSSAVPGLVIPYSSSIANSDYSSQPGWVTAASLTEPAFTLRKHQAFRAVPDGTNFQNGVGFTNARLIEWHENGAKAVEMTLRNDQPEGLAEAWYPDGQLKSRTRFAVGKIVKREFFPEAGQVPSPAETSGTP